MPNTEVFSQENQEGKEKVKTRDLFHQICELYDPFHSCFISFPLSLVAQARVWRGRGIPDEKQLEASLKALAEKGFEEGQAELLIAYCESAFRPIKTVELAMEELLPKMLFTRSRTWPPNSAGRILLETDFFNQWKGFEKKFGRGWVLAAGSVPLSIHGCPPLFAPWIVGATIQRWLALKKVEEHEGETLAINLTSILLGRPIRPEELRHWNSLLNEVEVTHDNNSKVLLPGYLIDIGRRMQPNDMGWGTTVGTKWTPKDYLKSVALDDAVCKELGKAIQKGWRPQTKSKTPHKVKQHRGMPIEASVEPEAEMRATCNLCTSSIALQDVYDHFRDIHGILRDEIETEPTRREIRRVRTREVLLRYAGS